MEDKKIVFVLVAICLTEGVLSSARSAVADALWKSGRLNTLLWLLPDHVEGRLERGEPGDRERAAAAGPQSKALIEMALEAERRGDLAGARRHLEEAARRDATFLPRWTLINFLMRHGQSRDVLSRAAPAAAIYEGDLSGLFDLCLRTGASPDQIYRTIVPARPKAQREFLQLLIRRGKQLDSLPVALRLADLAQPNDRDLLFDLCDQLLTAGEGLKVAQLWKRLPRFGRTEGRCLDWKQQAVEGIVMIEAGEAVVRLELSGRQPDSAVVLRRTLVVDPTHRYHLRALANGEDTIKSAVEWVWNGAVAGTGDQTDIEVDPKREISELTLVIRRRPGQRAAEGTLEITNIRLEPKAAALASAR